MMGIDSSHSILLKTLKLPTSSTKSLYLIETFFFFSFFHSLSKKGGKTKEFFFPIFIDKDSFDSDLCHGVCF